MLMCSKIVEGGLRTPWFNYYQQLELFKSNQKETDHSSAEAR